jgi:hypothetical protein
VSFVTVPCPVGPSVFHQHYHYLLMDLCVILSYVPHSFVLKKCTTLQENKRQLSSAERHGELTVNDNADCPATCKFKAQVRGKYDRLAGIRA